MACPEMLRRSECTLCNPCPHPLTEICCSGGLYSRLNSEIKRKRPRGNDLKQEFNKTSLVLVRKWVGASAQRDFRFPAGVRPGTFGHLRFLLVYGSSAWRISTRSSVCRQ